MPERTPPSCSPTEELQSRGLEVVAVANPLRSVAGDAA
jgi:hypothetical protein